MSTGNRLITKLLESGSSDSLRLIPEQYFVEEERSLFDFVRSHYARHGRLPSINTCRENNYRIHSADEDFDYYFERCRQRSLLNIIQEGQPEYMEAVQDTDPERALQVMQRMISDAAAIRSPHDFSDLQIEADKVYRQYLEDKYSEGNGGITLGWPTLDRITLGAQGGDVIVVVGRPGTGKSYTILNMAQAAWNTGHSSLFVSMEMTLPQITKRWISINTGLNPDYIRKGQLSTWGEDVFRCSIQNIDNKPPVNFLAGNFSKTVEDIQEAVRHMDPDVIYVDAAYLLGTRMQFSNNKARWEKTTEIIQGLKSVALATNKPVVITVQFNRDVKGKFKKELDLTSIAGADAIPQIASIVIGMQRAKSPHSATRRTMSIMKSRDGEDDKSITTNYLFNPVLNFDEVEDEDSEEEDVEEATAWMV